MFNGKYFKNSINLLLYVTFMLILGERKKEPKQVNQTYLESTKLTLNQPKHILNQLKRTLNQLKRTLNKLKRLLNQPNLP